MSRTLLSVNNYFYHRGGADVAFFRHNDLLRRLGWSVVPFSMRHKQNEPSPWSEHFVEEIELGEAYTLPQRVRKGLKSVYSFEARRRISRLIDSVSPDICHAHNVYHHISPSILSVVRKRGIPLVMTLHDLKIACPAYSMLARDGVCERCRGGRLFHVLAQRCMKDSLALSAMIMAESYLHRMLRSYTANVGRFVVPSRFYLRKLVEWGFDASMFSYVPNFVDASRMRPELSPGARFIYVGRLSREKGVGTLVRAAARAGVGLDVVGSGPERDRLTELAQSIGTDVRFRGFLSGDALHGAIRDARAVVLPSEWYENAPLTVLEAYALGKPVIVSSMGGLPEVVDTGRSGWIFEAGAVDRLADVLRSVADLHDDDVRAAGSCARKMAETRFSHEAYLREIRNIYRDLGVS